MTPRPDVSTKRKHQILDAAMKVFAQLGFPHARMEDIATEAELSKGALYWYFKSKDGIIIALLKRFFSGYMENLEEIREEKGSARERLLILVQRSTQEMERMSELFLPIAYEFYAVGMRDEEVRNYIREYFRTYLEIVTELIQEGIDQGEFRPVDAQSTAITLGALYEGLALMWAIDPETVRWKDVSERSIRLLMEGLQAERSPLVSGGEE